MNTQRLEELLEELVQQNALLVDKMDDVVAEIREIKEELNWVGNLTFAKQVIERLEAIETTLT